MITPTRKKIPLRTELRLLGLDPGLHHTGWGIIRYDMHTLSIIDAGTITSNTKASMAERLCHLFDGLMAVIETYYPHEAAIEEVFISRNAAATLKLGLARGVVFLAPAKANLRVSEYSANTVKKVVVGVGHATKKQVQHMVQILLPGTNYSTAHTADALAIAICHAYHITARDMSR